MTIMFAAEVARVMDKPLMGIREVDTNRTRTRKTLPLCYVQLISEWECSQSVGGRTIDVNGVVEIRPAKYPLG